MIAFPAFAQLSLPPLGDPVRGGPIADALDRTLDPLGRNAKSVARGAARLARERVSRLAALVDRNRESVEFDNSGEPARKGVLVLVDPSDADIAAARAAGFSVLERETLGELNIVLAQLRVPDRMPLARAQKVLRKLLPNATIAADSLHIPAGSLAKPSDRVTTHAVEPISTKVGLIDGAPGVTTKVGALRGFAAGAPRASDHGSATASLLKTAGVRHLVVADVYGTDPAGGNALAISRAIDWMIGQRTRVISISLVGPNNALLAQAIAAARRRGAIIVAPVGNSGPAAPPAYPASYTGVIAVTGVDGRNRALIEAGKALHLDYAAPGADMAAANAVGRRVAVRGTSYATPLVAARAAAAIASNADVTLMLDREAVDLGRKGPDPTFGRGLLCRECRSLP